MTNAMGCEVAMVRLVRDRRGRWQVAADYDRLPLPGSIRELVERRLAPLASTERALIEAAAVMLTDRMLRQLSKPPGRTRPKGRPK